MESINYLQNGVKELTKEDLVFVNGGGFAYDLGFFLRECVIYTINGGNVPGSVAAATDIALNYKPLH
jgi:hypothetical protein